MRKLTVLNLPNILTLLRIAAIPLVMVVYYLPFRWSNEAAALLFLLAAITDWMDGYLARRLNQISPFGAFLDPVADKLMVAAALVLLVADETVHSMALHSGLFTMMVIVILGREITVSALREWMAEIGKRGKVAVSMVGKVKTTSQMVAILFLLWREDAVLGLPTFRLGELLLYLAALLTLWSMASYLRAAWPALRGAGQKG